jgi:hypothetical protein
MSFADLLDNFYHQCRLTEFTWFLIMLFVVLPLTFLFVHLQDKWREKQARKKLDEELKNKK